MQEWRSCSTLTRETLEQEIIDEAPLNGVVAFAEPMITRSRMYDRLIVGLPYASAGTYCIRTHLKFATRCVLDRLKFGFQAPGKATWCTKLTYKPELETLKQEIIDEAPLNGVVAFTELVLRRMGTYQLRFYSEGLSVIAPFCPWPVFFRILVYLVICVSFVFFIY